MLGTVQNLIGCVPFRYLPEGKLFEVETQYIGGPCGKGSFSNGDRCIERCWLCD
jgi:hypothetical protein